MKPSSDSYIPSNGSPHKQSTKPAVRPVIPVVPVNQDVKAYFAEEALDNSQSWLLNPEIPSPDEIMGTGSETEFVDLLQNRIEGPWGSKEEYLKAHYELLREDAVAPLRDAVAYVREDPEMRDTNTISIYEKVYIVGITFTQQGVATRIQFSTIRSGKNIVWEYSKRLRSGTIVALSPADDSFRNKCVIAVVAARPLRGIKQHPPEIDIYFARPVDAEFDPHQEWLMVEARDGYFESMRHTMTALQKMCREKFDRFPLAEQICFLHPNTDTPEYVKADPVVDVQSAICPPGEEAKVNILENWPKYPTGDLDATQWRALEQMLTKSLAVIQGPPGTGKTFVSVIALRILLSNMNPGDPPIIVASQTNHALDQLLRHVSHFQSDYIRLGGRSNDLEIKKRTLFAVRQNAPIAAIQGSILGQAQRRYNKYHHTIADLLQNFSAENDDTPLPPELFAKYGLLTATQCDSLAKGAKDWIRPNNEEDDNPLLAWLGEQVVPFEVHYSTENFGFEEDEIDLEYEQLKELEAEQGNEEDDHEVLKGPFICIRERFCGQNTSASEEASRKYLREPDLWKVPVKARGGVYNTLRKLLKDKIRPKFQSLVTLNTNNCKDIRIGKWERDNHLLRDAKLIGMTTTGLSKYRALISSLKPKVALIEEAAEAIEAPVAAACLDSLQHMILVGDHQQLRGSCSVKDLQGEPFFLDISMFERLVNNGIQYETLRRQRRMAPEIRRLLEPIYGELHDHQSVLERPKVPGMGDVRSYFFSHNWPESSDSLSSKYNEKEAEMIIGFFMHLVLNGVAVKDITVLTFYNGQRKKLLKLFKENSYLQGQYGEENEVVILSLVRSGRPTIGFLSIENRVCVALSRARSGFYIFGDSTTLADADPLWWQVVTLMGGKNPKRRLGFYLPLTCTKHGNVIYKKDPSEWDAAYGGCDLPCNEHLACGHRCPLSCHR
ncbi:P-loop containing nucleoside triphosphate hydrolase protein [Aspergillus pseudonomiae]|uniref:P-loop containing nucleoside triphosphate hydrolase protein n=1 Tax=Aspergillus pseudonomiae TaxID=1506151 RepID=A0A5N7CXL8_9EURO|nr:P-loop containing nucleoside triphosphate hydrolase protein [Aspergillus pseudonomiae]KAE8398944.1 P-loop containing nucleoside triphosphate hydrolase protein [Aspergillus pseudonomiae]